MILKSRNVKTITSCLFANKVKSLRVDYKNKSVIVTAFLLLECRLLNQGNYFPLPAASFPKLPKLLQLFAALFAARNTFPEAVGAPELTVFGQFIFQMMFSFRSLTRDTLEPFKMLLHLLFFCPV